MKTLVGGVLAAMLLGVPGNAQTGQAPSAASAAPLVIGLGDLISVSIFDAPDLSGRFRVDQKGDVVLPLLDAIHVAGLTADQAAKLIEKAYVDAEILLPGESRAAVFIEEYTSQGITVSGEVKSPGVYPAFGVRMLNDVVTAAGGSTELASSKVIITRRGDLQHPITIPYDPRATPLVIPDVQIFPGDTVMVPKAGIVYVLGAVNRAGGFVLNGHDAVTALKVLALAGGAGRAPALKSAQLMRSLQNGGKLIFTVPLDKILKGNAADIALKDGDILYIPTSTQKLVAQQAITAAIGIGTSIAIYRTAVQ